MLKTETCFVSVFDILKSMKIKFIYNVKTELNSVIDTYDDKELILKFGYKYFLPKGFSIEDNNLDKLKSVIESEMNDSVIEGAKKNISDNWSLHQVELVKLLGKIKNDPPSEVKVVLTKYGTGGMYILPSTVVLNVYYKDYFDGFVHELIHCLIEKPIIQKYKVNHQAKEGIVDWLFLNNKVLKNMFPEYQKQNLSIFPDKNQINKFGLNYDLT